MQDKAVAMTKTLPRLRHPTLDDIKRTATPVVAPIRDTPLGQASESAPAGEAVPRVAPRPAIRDERRLAEARSVVRYYRRWTIAMSAAPIPLMDAALVSGVQIRMLSRLAQLYGVAFERVRVMSLVSALFGGWTPYTIATGVTGAAARLAPGVGTLIGIATSIGTSALATEAIGQMFVRHFEQGGTFLDFEPKKYRQQLEEAKRARKGAAEEES
jgi:uncharacterized protein (DUF697 family)